MDDAALEWDGPADGGELDFCGCGQGRGSSAGAGVQQRNVWCVAEMLQQKPTEAGFYQQLLINEAALGRCRSRRDSVAAQDRSMGFVAVVRDRS